LIGKIPDCQGDKFPNPLLHPPTEIDQLIRGNEQQQLVHNGPTKNAISAQPSLKKPKKNGPSSALEHSVVPLVICEKKIQKRDLGSELTAIRNVPNLSAIYCCRL
jgi:hypothetical protein